MKSSIKKNKKKNKKKTTENIKKPTPTRLKSAFSF